jgi:hypothetical protein
MRLMMICCGMAVKRREMLKSYCVEDEGTDWEDGNSGH